MSETLSTGTMHFTWDSTPTVPEVLGDGSYFYIYGPGGLPIEQIDASGNVSYFFHDGNGTTRALLASDGSIGATFTDNAFGVQTNATGSLNTPLLYAQSYTDPATGLLYMVNRYYDPITGQFVSVDPLLSETGSFYNYAGDDPTNQSDPTGLFCVLGHNPNGSCRGSNLGNDVKYVTVAVAAVATVAGIAAAAIATGPVAAVLTGVAFIAAGVTAGIGIAGVINTCLTHGIGSSECSDATLKNDLSTLIGLIPGKVGEIIGALSLLNLGPVQLSPGIAPPSTASPGTMSGSTVETSSPRSSC